MNSNKKPRIVKAGDTHILVTSINYQALQSQDMITCKKKIYSKDEVQENPLRLLFTIEDNGDIHYFGKELSTNYKFTKQDVGKYIKFYSNCKEFNMLAQCLVFYVEGEHDTDVDITGVECADSDSNELDVGENIKLKTNFSLVEDRVSSKKREFVKWMVRIGGEEGLSVVGVSSFNGIEVDSQSTNADGKLLSSFGLSAVHELLHTIGIDHPQSTIQSDDAELIHVGGVKFETTTKTDKRGIYYNIMAYGHIIIDSYLLSNLWIEKDPEYLTEGQLCFLLKQIDDQRKGAGCNQPYYNYSDYWSYPKGKEVNLVE